MGGRVALHVALAAPDRVERLVLVATTAGIADDGERAARRAADERLAAFAGRRDHRAVRRPLGRAAAVRRHAARGRAHLARGPRCATTRARWPPSCAAWAPARWSRCGSACASPDDAGDGPRRRARPEVRARWARALAAALPDATLVVVPRARPRDCPREAPDARCSTASSRSLDAEPGLRGHGDRAVLDGQTVSSSANSSSVPSPQAAVVFSAAAQWTAAAMPSGPSKVEAR